MAFQHIGQEMTFFYFGEHFSYKGLLTLLDSHAL